MEAPIHNQADSLPPQLATLYALKYGDTTTQLHDSVANASSHEEEDARGSDGWLLQSEASTMSSKATTPEPQISRLPRPPIDHHLSNKTRPTTRAGRTRPQLPFPPPPPPPDLLHGLSGREPRATRGPLYTAHHVPGVEAGESSSPPDPRMAWSRPPISGSPAAVQRKTGERDAIPRPSSPSLSQGRPRALPIPNASMYSSNPQIRRSPVHSYAMPHSLRFETEDRDPDLPSRSASSHSRWPDMGKSRDLVETGPFPFTSAGRNPPMAAVQAAGFRPHYESETSLSGSSSFQEIDDDGEISNDESSSSEDLIAYRNARQFPPQLPAAPPPRDKSAALNHIATWVSQYETSQKPWSPERLGRSSEVPREPVFPGSAPGSTTSIQRDREIERLWQSLKEKRSKLHGIKTEMSSRRRQLKKLRRERDAADNAFMGLVRPLLVNQKGSVAAHIEHINMRFAEMQNLRSEYSFTESNYEGLEDLLDEEEEILFGLETRFFSLLAAGRAKEEKPAVLAANASDVEAPTTSQMPDILRGISRDGPTETLHPLYVELTAAIGDLDNAKEDHQDLVWAREQHEYELGIEEATGRKTLDPMEDFLEEFSPEEERLAKSIKDLEGKVQHLRAACEEKKVMRKHLTARMAYALDPTSKFEDMDLDDRETILAKHKTLAHAQFPELLSQPNHLLEPMPLTPLAALKAATKLPPDSPNKRDRMRMASKEFALDRLVKEPVVGSKSNFINRWLLHQLQESPLLAVLLHSTFVMSRGLRIKDPWRWQCDVMYYWWRDSTAAAEEQQSSLMTSGRSAYSSPPLTPQMSRAASDSGLGQRRPSLVRGASSSAMTVMG
ncbi:hypothetical protein B0I35DRAFT_440041 [Stachybotrys elegans]|uniref:Uncharacterized protein n=1 Tax=Stachybotrys elegans TaxID=80388 RepID=A0A8K0SDY7_9HYPO|nr:hypothetical protein B0I35DRAFT_440041 [Stachybotrys elegans]